MKESRISAYSVTGELLALADILCAIGELVGCWRMIQFEGTSRADSSLNILQLEHALDVSPQGIDYTWLELISIARSVEQAIDLTIVLLDEVSRCVFVLEARDGTYWRVLCEESNHEAIAALGRVEMIKGVRIYR